MQLATTVGILVSASFYDYPFPFFRSPYIFYHAIHSRHITFDYIITQP